MIVAIATPCREGSRPEPATTLRRELLAESAGVGDEEAAIRQLQAARGNVSPREAVDTSRNPPPCATAILGGVSAVGIAPISVRYDTAIYEHATACQE